MRDRFCLIFVALLALLAVACTEDGSDADTTASATSTQLVGAWGEGPSLRGERAEIAAAVLDGRIYTGGGFDGRGQDLSSFEVLDPAAGGWQSRAPIPLALNHLGIAAAAGRIWVSGGTGRLGVSNALFAYDPATDAWTQRTAMPLRRSAHVMVAVDDRLYVIGGVGDEVRVTLVYDPATDAWERRAPMPAEREHLSAAAVGGRIYVIGGRWSDRGNVDTVEEYDPATDTWRSRAPLPTARGGLTAATVGERIHVLGGEAFNPNRTFAEHEVYTPASDSWASAPPMPTARHGLASAGLDGRLYVIAGGRVAGLAASDILEIFTPE